VSDAPTRHRPVGGRAAGAAPRALAVTVSFGAIVLAGAAGERVLALAAAVCLLVGVLSAFGRRHFWADPGVAPSAHPDAQPAVGA
jgi:uncharacterized membrane protein